MSDPKASEEKSVGSQKDSSLEKTDKHSAEKDKESKSDERRDAPYEENVVIKVPKTATTLGASIDQELTVMVVVRRSPAWPHLKFGDKILCVGGEKVSTLDECTTAMRSSLTAGTIKLRVRRTQNPGVLHVEVQPPKPGQAWGFCLDRFMSVNKVDPDSPAHHQLRVGDLIMEINDKKVAGVNETMQMLSSCDPTKALRIRLRRSPGVAGPEPTCVLIDTRFTQYKGLGAHVNEHLMVMKVEHGSPADTKLQMNDMILAINDKPVSNMAEAMAELAAAGDKYTMLVRPYYITPIDMLAHAPVATKTDAVIEHNIPATREKNNVRRQNGFDYFLASFVYDSKAKIGMVLATDKHKRVLVSDVEEGSITHGTIRKGDRLLDVDGTRVSDKKEAVRLIIERCKKHHRFTCVVERPISADAEKNVHTQMSLIQGPAPVSVIMPSDIQQIVNKARTAKKSEAGAQEGKEQPKGILRNPEGQNADETDAPKHDKNIEHANEHNETHMHRDTPAEKKLRPVGKLY